ncbi:MAG TPA: transglutaminase N-terminal domain-containing protein, partial [Draconibacterium sp.]|nr:transglutaminase N-terminal domain-containing protein [Draconibacterium sp.]
MKFKITHETIYQYNSEVFFEPHLYRFKPKNTPFIRVENFDLKIAPKAAGITEQVDAENNFVHFGWFEGMNNRMTVKLDMLVETIDFNPFNFILYPNQYFDIPFTYSNELANILQPSIGIFN